jgi:hypothetical protein
MKIAFIFAFFTFCIVGTLASDGSFPLVYQTADDVTNMPLSKDDLSDEDAIKHIWEVSRVLGDNLFRANNATLEARLIPLALSLADDSVGYTVYLPDGSSFEYSGIDGLADYLNDSIAEFSDFISATDHIYVRSYTRGHHKDVASVYIQYSSDIVPTGVPAKVHVVNEVVQNFIRYTGSKLWLLGHAVVNVLSESEEVY